MVWRGGGSWPCACIADLRDMYRRMETFRPSASHFPAVCDDKHTSAELEWSRSGNKRAMVAAKMEGLA